MVTRKPVKGLLGAPYLIENKIELAEKHIVSLRINNDELVKAKQDMIEELDDRVHSTQTSIDNLVADITNLSSLIEDNDTVSKRKSKLTQMQNELEAKIKKL